MVSLLDIAPATAKVDCGGKRPVEVRGVSVRGISLLLARFPALAKVMSGGEAGPEDLIKLAPDAVAAIIAAGLGKPGDAEMEAAADQLPIETQLDLLGPILRLTMPKGVGPFVEKLAGVMGALGVDQSASA